MCMCVRVCDWEPANANARTNERLHKLLRLNVNRVPATPLFTHIGLAVGHEHGEVGEVAAGAGGVCVVGVQQLAALRRPLARHGALRVVPEGAVGSVVVIHLAETEKQSMWWWKHFLIAVCVNESRILAAWSHL